MSHANRQDTKYFHPAACIACLPPPQSCLSNCPDKSPLSGLTSLPEPASGAQRKGKEKKGQKSQLGQAGKARSWGKGKREQMPEDDQRQGEAGGAGAGRDAGQATFLAL